MEKSDKELTAEIVIAFLESWSGPNKNPARAADLPALIQLVFNTIQGLTSES